MTSRNRILVGLALLCCLVLNGCAGSWELRAVREEAEWLLREAREEAAWLQREAEAAVADAEEDAAAVRAGVRTSLTPWGTQAGVNRLIRHMSEAAQEDFARPVPHSDLIVLIGEPYYRPPRLLNFAAPQHRQTGTIRKVGHFLVILRDGRLFVIDTRGTPRLVNRHDIPPPEPLEHDADALAPPPDIYHRLLATGNTIVAVGQSHWPESTIVSAFRLDPMTGRLELLSDLLVNGTPARDVAIAGDRLIMSTEFGMRSLSGAEPMPTVGWLRRMTGTGGTVSYAMAGPALPLVAPEQLYGPFTPVSRPRVTAVINCPLTPAGGRRGAGCQSSGFVSGFRTVLKVEDDATYLVLPGDAERAAVDFAARTLRGILELGPQGHRLIDDLELEELTPANRQAFCATPVGRAARASETAAVVRLPHDPTTTDRSSGLSLLHGVPDSAADLAVHEGRLHLRTVLKGFSCMPSSRGNPDVQVADAEIESRRYSHLRDEIAEQTFLESIPLSAMRRTVQSPLARSATPIPDYLASNPRAIMHEGWLVYSLDTSIEELLYDTTDAELAARTGRYWIAAVPLDRPAAAAIIEAPMNVAWFHPLQGQLLMAGETLDPSWRPRSPGMTTRSEPAGSLFLSLLRLGDKAQLIGSQSVTGLGLQRDASVTTGIGSVLDGRVLAAIPTEARLAVGQPTGAAVPGASLDQTETDGITVVAIRQDGRITPLQTIQSSWVSLRAGAATNSPSDPFPNGYTCQVCDDWDWLRVGMVADGVVYTLMGGHLSIMTLVADAVIPVTRIDLTDPSTTPKPL